MPAKKEVKSHPVNTYKGPVISLSVYVVVLIEDLSQTSKPGLAHLNVADSVHDQ